MATKSIAWDSGGGYIRLTYTGSGNGTISVESDVNNLGTSRSKTITIKTTQGGLTTQNVTVKQAACPFPVGDVKDYNYTGSVQSVLLPAGSYKLQCWGAQGGNVSGSYTAAGSKGGYSEGVLTLPSPTTVYIFVGGKGADISTSTTTSGVVNGGWNGGGGAVRIMENSQSYAGYTYGKSFPRGGGGATDIALVTSSMSYSNGVTNRSSASLLSRIIVAGGGGGASACYYEYPEQETQVTESIAGSSYSADSLSIDYSNKKWANWSGLYAGHLISVTSHRGESCTFTGGNAGMTFVKSAPVNGAAIDYASGYGSSGYNNAEGTVTVPSDAVYLWIQCNGNDTSGSRKPTKIEFSKVVTVTKSGYGVSSGIAYGGGTTAGGNYTPGTQTTGYAFGKGATRTANGDKFGSGGGGGGWYGGNAAANSQYPTSLVNNCDGGSGWVNTAASAGNRPSGYTGLQLDSGETKAGNTTFKSPSGTNETGHAGNGYARITRLS